MLLHVIYCIFEYACGFKSLHTAQMAATPLCTAEVSAVCLHRWMEGKRLNRLIALRYESDCTKQQKMANQCLPFFIDPTTTLQVKPYRDQFWEVLPWLLPPLLLHTAAYHQSHFLSIRVLKSHAMSPNASRWRDTVTVETSESHHKSLHRILIWTSLHERWLCMAASPLLSWKQPENLKMQLFNNMEAMCCLFKTVKSTLRMNHIFPGRMATIWTEWCEYFLFLQK